MLGIFKKHDQLKEKVAQLEANLEHKERKEGLLRNALKTIGSLSKDNFIKEIAEEAINENTQ